MPVTDVVILVIIFAVCALGVRKLMRSRKEGCASCGDKGCSARSEGGHCGAAKDMLRHADEALGDKGRDCGCRG